MISIQSIMLAALGFLSATLLGLLIAPAFWNRAVRLTTRRLKEQLPLSEAEIRADKDRLRAEYAIRVHKLEMKLEQLSLQRARDTIEINRRDSVISQLEQQRSVLNAAVEENQNARLVLEQTVADRLPKVEARLNEAKQLLFSRDRDIAELTQSTTRQQLALEEAHSINKQQTAELDRLTTALTVRGGRNQDSLSDPKFDGELALRSEIEALRAKTREQAGMIGRLQSQQAAQMGVLTPLGEAGLAPLRARNGADPRSAQQQPNLALVVPDEARMVAEREIRNLRARIDDQSAEIARLSGELQTFKANEDTTGLKDSKIALKARLNAAQSHSEHNSETIKRLRAELAAANERLALQGAHFMEQMRRLGAGTLPTAGQTRRPVTQNQKLTLAERVSQTRPPLTPVTQRSSDVSATEAAAEKPSSPSLDPTPPAAPQPAALSAQLLQPAQLPALPAAPPAASLDMAAATGTTSTPPSATVIPLPSVAEANGHAAAPAPSSPPPASPEGAPRKPRLIDRISSINKA